VNKTYITAFTHSGKFHADDVFSAALLKIIYPDIEIQRGNSVPVDFKGLVFDIGYGEFDHHQKGSPVRDNNIPYASFGLLWKAYGEGILGELDAKEFDEYFIQQLDLNDNTGTKNILADIIESFNPPWNRTIDMQEAFNDACTFAKTILEKQIEKLRSESDAIEYIATAVDEASDGILILDKYIPWKKAIKSPEIKYVILASQRGGYKVQPTNEKYYFPECWRGLQQEKLVVLTGIPSIIFCHKSGFLCTTNSLEDAKKLCLKSLSILDGIQRQAE
jgi:Uncharacterized conserved protein related to MYG1 family